MGLKVCGLAGFLHYCVATMCARTHVYCYLICKNTRFVNNTKDIKLMCKYRGVGTTGAPGAGTPPKIFTCMCMLHS